MTGFLQAAAYHPVRYWRQGMAGKDQNFGDYLTELFLERFFIVPSFPADAYHLVGSVIFANQMQADLTQLTGQADNGRVAFWGCGVRDGKPASAWVKEHGVFFGVRGPLSREALGLPADTVLGDPGLLVPLLRPARPARRHGRSLGILHMSDPRTTDDVKAETGVDEVIRAGIPGTREALLAILDKIAGADFVLSGALHGAIIACAYGVPFAFYDSGYVNVPFKWRDFSLSVGLPCLFAKSLEEGRTIHRQELAPNYRPLPLAPILANAPFTVRQEMLLRAMAYDGVIRRPMMHRMIKALRDSGVDRPDTIAAAQAAWLEQARTRRKT